MQTSEDVGGSGGESASTTTRDVRLLERTVCESWDLAEDMRQAAVGRLGTLISDPTTKTRAFVAATLGAIHVSHVPESGWPRPLPHCSRRGSTIVGSTSRST